VYLSKGMIDFFNFKKSTTLERVPVDIKKIFIGPVRPAFRYQVSFRAGRVLVSVDGILNSSQTESLSHD
jgi:hypothetical protein